eukprot:10993556-Alexandrium_andersonii.AAC.1
MRAPNALRARLLPRPSRRPAVPVARALLRSKPLLRQHPARSRRLRVPGGRWKARRLSHPSHQLLLGAPARPCA